MSTFTDLNFERNVALREADDEHGESPRYWLALLTIGLQAQNEPYLIETITRIMQYARRNP